MSAARWRGYLSAGKICLLPRQISIKPQKKIYPSIFFFFLTKNTRQPEVWHHLFKICNYILSMTSLILYQVQVCKCAGFISQPSFKTSKSHKTSRTSACTTCFMVLTLLYSYLLSKNTPPCKLYKSLHRLYWKHK